MIDLTLWAATKQGLTDFAKLNGLYEQYVEEPAVVDGNGTVTTPAVMAWRTKPGIEYSWWNGSGKLMTAPAVTNANGDVTTPPTFAPGVVCLLRLHSEFFGADTIENAADANEWSRSKVARYVKTNGVPGTLAGLTYYKIDGVRLFRYADVVDWCAARGVPHHVYL